MADKKISQLTGAITPLVGTEILPIVQSSSTVKVSVDNLTAGRAVSMASATISGDLTVDTNTLLVDSTNNYVGIGGTPSVPLEVYANNSGIIINNTGAANKKWRLGGGSASQFLITEAGVADQFQIDTSGNVSVLTGNLVIGTSGKGIDFSATPGTGTSELLADYEEGTWTPADTSGGGLTLTVIAAYYVKVGNIVTLTGRVTYPVNVDANQTRISIPFATKGPTAFTVSSNYPASVFGYGNVSSMFFYLDGQGAITNASAAGLEFNISFTYIAA